ncbi:P-loop containing nucleoside triphosphate hydrolase protein [Coprinopsis sp. MPI-PUGE-AT-0042]|nr:P-loop containing nucleoside triphosphate hydrolase protein [Coprinopsis sp. MPI-PUGE-AT-0042]
MDCEPTTPVEERPPTPTAPDASGSARPQPSTPRKRKAPGHNRLPGIKKSLPERLSVESIKKRLRIDLALSYTPDDWQAHLIRRVLQGYDSILCAGTGYGKSLVFEGLAKLGGRKKVVVVICPLKALEHDQAAQAQAKGLKAVVINSDNSNSKALWADARLRADIIYISPEMALSNGFANLWKDGAFRKRLIALIIDEAHCVEEWGTDDFRPLYRQLDILQHYTGLDIPSLACTATCSTTTF